MPRRNKIETPDWILKGEGAEKNKKTAKGKTFSIRECPKCRGDDVRVVLGGEEGKGSQGWECAKCGWKGKNISEKELSEEEFMKYLDERGMEVA
jgi:uncharacterized ferredoxin-like protein